MPLAERMVQKYISEDKIDAEQEIQLYLMILDMQVSLYILAFIILTSMLVMTYRNNIHYCTIIHFT